SRRQFLRAGCAHGSAAVEFSDGRRPPGLVDYLFRERPPVCRDAFRVGIGSGHHASGILAGPAGAAGRLRPAGFRSPAGAREMTRWWWVVLLPALLSAGDDKTARGAIV